MGRDSLQNHDALLRAHKRLDYDCRHRQGRVFVSDWYCEHDLVDSMFALHEHDRLITSELLPYRFQNDSEELHKAIQKFHASRSERSPDIEEIFVTAGLSPLITAQMLLLKRAGFDRVGYFQPIYYTYYFLANVLGIELVALNQASMLSEEPRVSLPNEASLPLILCDPIWFAGRPIPPSIIEEVSKWQARTENFVFVDGAFQYLKWHDAFSPEITSSLNPELTFRNCCPTKAAATHGLRFAYCIHPKDWREELRYCYANTSGAGSYLDLRASRYIMDWLNSSVSNTKLLSLIARRHEFLVECGAIRDPLNANSGYFSFVKVSADPSALISMDEVFFDTTGFPGFVRLNSLMPRSSLQEFLRRSNMNLSESAARSLDIL